MSLALIVMRWAAWFTVLAFVTGVLLVVRSWARGGERLAAFKNAVLLVVVGGLGFCVWASRINIYERIFAPAETVQFISADQANLRPDDMVIAVSINNTNRAYPILQMAYHHVINDVAGGVPVVSTY